MKSFLLALEIEPVEAGRTYFRLPLHCTILHWFLTGASADEVLARAQSIFAATAPILLTSGQSGRFGPSKGPKVIPVNRLLQTPELADLHRRLYHAVEPLNVRHTEPYILDDYIFHVSKQGRRRFAEGETHLARTAYLVEALDPLRIGRKLVRAKIPLV